MNSITWLSGVIGHLVCGVGRVGNRALKNRQMKVIGCGVI